MFLNPPQKLCKLGKVAVRVVGDGEVMAVEEAVGQKKDLHAKRGGDHVLVHVVSYHQAFRGLGVDLAENVTVIIQVRLAMARVLIGGVEKEVIVLILTFLIDLIII